MSKTLRIYLILGVCALQATAVLATILLTGATTNDLLVKLMGQQMNIASGTAVDNAESVLVLAGNSAEIAQRVVESDLSDPADQRAFEEFLVDELLVNTAISGIYWGSPDGRFIMVQHDPANPAQFHTKVIDVVDGQRTVTNIFRDEDFEEVRRSVDPADAYDPRTRPWYQEASPTDGNAVVWTDPYVFASSQRPGITAAVPVRDYEAPFELRGVIGVDIELTGLSQHLAESVRVSPNGTTVMVDGNGEVIASARPDAVVRPDSGGVRRARIDEIGDAPAAAAFTSAREQLRGVTPERPLSVDLEVDGVATRAVFSRLEEHDNWFVVVVAPESDFVGEIQRTRQINALVAVAVGLGVVVLALPVLRYLANRGARLHARATTDALTGLANRRHFEETLSKEMTRARTRRSPLSVAMLDLDHFKGINDTYGHGVGDQALIAVAGRLTDAVRENDLVARLGGDEFCILFRGLDLTQATAVLERARASIEATPISTDQGPVGFSVTIGVADLVPGVEDDAALLRRADQALYVAKDRGRNQVATILEVDPAAAALTVPSSAPERAAPTP